MTNNITTKTVAASESDQKFLRAERRSLAKLVADLMPFAVVGLFVLGVLYTLYFAAELILPLFFAYFLSITLKPAVVGMTTLGIPKSVSAAIILFSLLGTVTATLYYVSEPLQNWAQRVPSMQREIELKLWPVKKSIEKAKEATKKIEAIADVKSPSLAEQEVTIKTPSLGERIVQTTWFTVVQIVIALSLTFFLLSRNEERTNRLLRQYVLKDDDRDLDAMFAAVQQSLTRYLSVSVIIYGTLGIVTAAAMALYGMPNPLLWGPVGALLAAPILAYIMVVFRHLTGHVKAVDSGNASTVA